MDESMQIILFVIGSILLIGIGVGIAVLIFGIKFMKTAPQSKEENEPNEYE